MPDLEPVTPKPKKTLLLVLAGLIILGLIGYLGNWAYQNYKAGQSADKKQADAPKEESDTDKFNRLVGNKEYDEAIKLIDKLDGNETKKNYLRLGIAKQKGDQAQIALLEAKLQSDPNLTFSQAIGLADDLLAKGKKQEAKLLYQKALTLLEASDYPTKEDEIMDLQRKIKEIGS